MRCIGLVLTVDAGADVAALPLRNSNLRLQRSSVLVYPLQLRQMPIEDLDDLL